MTINDTVGGGENAFPNDLQYRIYIRPDGSLDSANTSYTIRYELTDVDDDFGAGLQASLYFAESGGLSTVQDIRIFGTLIADAKISGTLE